ncbi:MAG: tRNA (adenosine(37)-N6)-dimethylallyltransferase MiaA [Firmicutes bacterium]|nr:tRNA (adenosine(37)-N6)-dimethylallyltransferase MiaA [Bacillota bacterium]
MKKILLPVIAGPTASGKSDVAVKLALRFNGEVVSADSMQIYKFMDIGTAKVDKETRARVPHHMLDIVTPDVNYSLAMYQKQAGDIIEAIAARGQLPLLAGGTGLYIKALIENYPLDQLPHDPQTRERLASMWLQKGEKHMYSWLAQVAPEDASRINIGDKRRVLRALEIYCLTGRAPSEIHSEARAKSPFVPLLIGLTMPRKTLYAKINRRAQAMAAAGLPQEYSMLISMGFAADANSMLGLGYRQAGMLIKGIWSEQQMLEHLQRDTRRYAKRQLTWFRSMQDIIWLDNRDPAKTVDTISVLIAGKSGTFTNSKNKDKLARRDTIEQT